MQSPGCNSLGFNNIHALTVHSVLRLISLHFQEVYRPQWNYYSDLYGVGVNDLNTARREFCVIEELGLSLIQIMSHSTLFLRKKPNLATAAGDPCQESPKPGITPSQL